MSKTYPITTTPFEIKKLGKLRKKCYILIVIFNILFFLIPSADTLAILRQNKLHKLNLIKKNFYKD